MTTVRLHPEVKRLGSNTLCKPQRSAYEHVLGKTLAQDVHVVEPYPPFDASIMDGYAICCADLLVPGGEDRDGWTHRITSRIYAGDEIDDANTSGGIHSDGGKLPPAAYVTTGAVIPAPYDAVMPVEVVAVSADGQYLRIHSKDKDISPGKWIRKVGCDMAQGEVALAAGTVLQPPHIGILVQAGADEVQVRRVPTVGVLSTGNEILPPHQRLQSKSSPSPSSDIGKIPDVNRPMLLSTLASWDNCTPVDLGIATDDDMEQLAATLASAINRCDVVISTGGISMGEKDVMEDVLVEKLGATVHFGRIHMKPGKPTTFMTVQVPHPVPQKRRTCLVFCLPGNPVSGIVCSHLFVRPCLDLLVQGVDAGASLEDIVENATVQEEVVATLAQDVKLDVERPEYRRVALTYTAKGVGGGGEFVATSTGVQRSSRLMSMNGADGLMLLPKGEPGGGRVVAKAGEQYPVMLLGSGAIGTARVKVRDSIHMNGLPGESVGGSFKPKLATVIVANSNYDMATNHKQIRADVMDALGSTNFSPCEDMSVSTEMVLSIGISDTLKSLEQLKGADVVLVICGGTSFQENLTIAADLRSIIDKNAEAMALQARKGAAETHPTSALFEVTAGFVDNDGMEFMVLLLSDDGLKGALSKVKGLLSHGVKVAKGL